MLHGKIEKNNKFDRKKSPPPLYIVMKYCLKHWLSLHSQGMDLHFTIPPDRRFLLEHIKQGWLRGKKKKKEREKKTASLEGVKERYRVPIGDRRAKGRK